ncbi:hypothetical protein [Poseidonibacter ostreae]|uniref:Uncharacterized protein n=1 Tax=Poseidonibacter ostreae TaxID=2654171 RepID=A0A6L4WWE1_9BACT|nr:hypothetical protein [Poseidonibacter ostreae]KAB7891372.1 hypothetical protein GBG19_00620 [Poseidonibacter ostreae]
MLKAIIDECTPTIGTKNSACVDLYASKDVVLKHGRNTLVPLGVTIDIDSFVKANKEKFEMNFYEANENGDDGSHVGICPEKVEEYLNTHVLELHIRSSLSAKNNLSIANGTGIIDLDFPKEIQICICNPMVDTDRELRELYDKTSDDEKGLREFKEKAKDILFGITIKKGQRIAQIGLVAHETNLLGIKTEEERKDGFGSTNKK